MFYDPDSDGYKKYYELNQIANEKYNIFKPNVLANYGANIHVFIDRKCNSINSKYFLTLHLYVRLFKALIYHFDSFLSDRDLVNHKK